MLNVIIIIICRGHKKNRFEFVIHENMRAIYGNLSVVSCNFDFICNSDRLRQGLTISGVEICHYA